MNIDVSSGYDAQTISGEAWRLQVSLIRNQQVVRSTRIAGSISPTARFRSSAATIQRDLIRVFGAG